MRDETKTTLALGGSDIGPILGVGDYFRDEHSVWVEKKFGRDYQPPAMRLVIGKALEQGIAQIYTHQTKRELEWVDRTFQHPDRPFQCYTPDALLTKERGGLDCKNVALDQSWKWGESETEIPPSVYLQAMWYMSATDRDFWDIAVLIAGADLRIYRVNRDPQAERHMLAIAASWWERYLVGDEEPPLTGSRATHQWLARRFPNHKRPDMRKPNEAELAYVLGYINVRADLVKLIGARGEMEAEIKRMIGEREGLEFPQGKITWRKTKDGTKTDWQSIALNLLGRLVPKEERGAILQLHTSPKPGTRRFLLDSPLVKEPEEEF
jgi:predicted phage-related endonuclease